MVMVLRFKQVIGMGVMALLKFSTHSRRRRSLRGQVGDLLLMALAGKQT